MLLLALLLYVFTIMDKPFIFMGKEIGPMKVEKYYNTINSSLDSAYVLKNGISQGTCISYAKDFFTKNHYKFIDETGKHGQSVWASKDNHILLIRCTNSESNTIFISGYGKYPNFASSRIGMAYEYLEERIKLEVSEKKEGLYYGLSWSYDYLPEDISRINCLNSYKKTYMHGNIKIKSKGKGHIYGIRDDIGYLSICFDGAYALYLSSNKPYYSYMKSVEEEVKHNFYKNLKLKNTK